MLVKEEWEQLDHLMARPLLSLSCQLHAGAWRLRGGCVCVCRRGSRLVVVVVVVFCSSYGLQQGFFPKIDTLPWETINEALTSIEDLTALHWVYNNDESDPLQNEKLTQRNLDKCLLSALPPWKISLALMWKSNKNFGGVSLVMGNDASD